MTEQYDNILKVSINTNAGGDFYLSLGDFLDAFYRADDAKRHKMIADPPLDMPEREHVPFLAAAAHKLAVDCGAAAPRWTFERRCYLPGGEPFFACNARGALRLLFMYKSPIEFKHRGLFVDENVLERT